MNYNYVFSSFDYDISCSFTWTHCSKSAAKFGVNCIIWVNDRPSKSKITVPPQICVVGSSIDAAIVTCTARNKSIKGHFDGFQRSRKYQPEMAFKKLSIRVNATRNTYFRIQSIKYGSHFDHAMELILPALEQIRA